MTKIVLGKRPSSIHHIVKFVGLDGAEMQVPVEYRYRTRIEYERFVAEQAKVRHAQHLDEIQAAKAAQEAAAGAAEAQPAADAQVQVTSADVGVQEHLVRAEAEFLADILVGWGLDVPLTPETLQQFADEYPAGSRQVLQDYAAAIFEGRRGN